MGFAILCGFVYMYLISELIGQMQEQEDPVLMPASQKEASNEKSSEERLIKVAIATIGLSVHNIADGLALGTSLHRKSLPEIVLGCSQFQSNVKYSTRMASCACIAHT
jgi:zinc transporter ZupT